MNFNPSSNKLIHYDRAPYSEEQLLHLYKAMLKPRMIEEKMLILLRQGKISKWFSGIGQEAISVGISNAVHSDEYILPMHRNLGVFTSRQVPLRRLFSQWQGREGGFTKGRDRSFHFGSQTHKIIGMISHLGPQMGIANGIALAHKLRNESKLTVVFSGEGGTSEGDFHEALNIASVWSLPVLFCIENNGYGLSTPANEQYNCKSISDKGIGYGIESHCLDGNNILEVHSKIEELANNVRERPRPILLEFKTFRIRGHEEASGTTYVPQELLDQWAKKDPVKNFRSFLWKEQLLTEQSEQFLEKDISNEIETELKIAFEQEAPTSSEQGELQDVYLNWPYSGTQRSGQTKKIRLVDAVSEGLYQSMERNRSVVLMGQDIAEYGGVFKVTKGFVEKFGKERVRNTPICESGIIEAAYGLSINGYKSVVELQFSDFISSGFNPVVNVLAKSYYRWGQNADVVLRMPCGGGVGAGPFHSQTNEAWFTKTPGLKVVYPAFPYDAKGLLATAIEDPNPVLYFEHKALYRSISQEVPSDYYTLPLGKAALVSTGNNLSIITYGQGVHWAMDEIESQQLSADILDLRTLQPLDTEAIYDSVKKTGKVLILQEDSLFGGIASDIAAMIAEHCFEYLDAPVKRVASLDTPIPFAANLEDLYLPKNRFKLALKELNDY
jgi:2-oxoisovalerate dehydrogenase E1 component